MTAVPLAPPQSPEEGLSLVRDAVACAMQSKSALATTSLESRIHMVVDACERITDRRYPATVALRDHLCKSLGYSVNMVQWALDSTFGLFSLGELRELWKPFRKSIERDATQLRLSVLAGNVFTACARALFFPWLTGTPVIVKASSDERVMPQALKHFLFENTPQLRETLQILPLGRKDTQANALLLSNCDWVTVYGDDESVRQCKALCQPGAVFVGRGAGTGIAAVWGKDIASPEQIRRVAHAIAFDVVAYEQLGCLSPQSVVLISQQPALDEEFAEALFTSLQALDHEFTQEQAFRPQSAVARWLRTGAALGRVYSDNTCAVSLERGAFRPSPGYRCIQVLRCQEVAQLSEEIRKRGKACKIVGLSVSLLALAEDITKGLECQPIIASLGQMQSPPLDAAFDGIAPLSDLFRSS